MIIRRYLIREISKPMLAMCPLLAVMFASLSAAQLLQDAVNGLLPLSTLATLIALRTIIALEVLVPITFFLSVVIGLGRLYSDSEIVVMLSSGLTPGRIIRVVSYTALAIAGLVAGLSMYARPWAYIESYQLEARAEARADVDRLQAGRFVPLSRDTGVMLVTRRDGPGHWTDGAFVERKRNGTIQVIYAREALARPGRVPGQSLVTFREGRLYELDPAGNRDQVVEFSKFTLQRNPRPVAVAEHKVKATPTHDLVPAGGPRELAELQWRLAAPVSTLLLGLLAFPLSQVHPRSGRYAKFGTVMLVYAAYYTLTIVARSWVKDGFVGPLPGIWWAPGLLALLSITALTQPALALRRRARFVRAGSARGAAGAPETPDARGDHPGDETD